MPQKSNWNYCLHPWWNEHTLCFYSQMVISVIRLALVIQPGCQPFMINGSADIETLTCPTLPIKPLRVGCCCFVGLLAMGLSSWQKNVISKRLTMIGKATKYIAQFLTLSRLFLINRFG